MAGPDAREVAHQVHSLGFSLDDKAATSLAAYLALLERWNRRTNLVGRQDWKAVLNHLVVDSFHLAAFLSDIPLPQAPLSLDLGAGAGLPGLPLRTLWSAGEYWLVEVREKRAGFMRSALARMELNSTFVHEGRAEEALAIIAPDSRADLILSRAFMPWADLLPFVAPMLAPEGFVVILANRPAPDTLPAEWDVAASQSYHADGVPRFLWALSKR